MNTIQVFNVTNKRVPLPVAISTIPAGFPSPAVAYEEVDLDINDIVVSNPLATFFARVKGNSMIDANIKPGDILVIDKSVEPVHGKVVIAFIDGAFTVKTFYSRDGVTKLVPANPEYPEIIPKEGEELIIWGVVLYTIHKN